MTAHRAEALRQAVDRIRGENELTYGSEDAQANIEAAIARSFPLPWVYLFELLQNALDLHARSVRIVSTASSREWIPS